MKNEAKVGDITVGGQPSADEIPAGRYSTIVNIRGDDEPGNMTAAMVKDHDAVYSAVPWTIDTVTPADIEKIREAVDAADGPVLIH